MICFLGKTFCNTSGCDCLYPKWDDEHAARAEKWWNPNDTPEKRGTAPVAFILHQKTT